MFNLSLLADIEEIVDDRPTPAEEVKPTEAEITEDAKVEVEQAEEGGDIEVKDTEVLAESQILSAQFDDLLAMQQHIAKFGIDRTFLSLFNKGGRLGRALGVDIPACESIDAVGYPTSALSMACLEALGNGKKGVIAKIVDFIVALMHKIKNLAARFWTWLTGLLDNQSTKWLKLQRIAKNRIVSKNVGSDIIVPAIGAEFDAKLGERFRRTGFIESIADGIKWEWEIIAKIDIFSERDLFYRDIDPDSIRIDHWTNSNNAHNLAAEIARTEHDMTEPTTITANNADAALKRLANNIRAAFEGMGEVKKVLGIFNEKIKQAEDMVTKAKNGVEKSVNFNTARTKSWRTETESKGLTFGSGDKKAVTVAKNALVDLKQRQSAIQKVANIYTRCIKIMVRSYAKVLFTFTIEK